MKKYLFVLIAVGAILAGTDCPAEDQSQVSAWSGMHYEWWGSNDDSSGTQFYIPVKVSASRKDFTMSVLGAYIYTEVDPEGGTRQSLSQMSDTKLNLSYRVYDKLPFDVLFGLGFNLPTGHTNLTENQMTLLVQPDLFSIPFFGEGFNVNPTVTVAKGWDRWVAGLSVGYTWKGKYDYNYEIENYDPGDVLTVTGEVDHDLSANLLGRLFGQYIRYNKDTVDGEDYYQEGDIRLIGTGLSYTMDRWDLAFTITGIFRDKIKFSNAPTYPLVTEDNKGHGNEFNTGLTYRYHTDEKTTVRTSLMLLYLAENGYPSDSPYYTGERRKATLGCGLDRTLARNLVASFGIEGFVMDDDKNWYHPDEDVTYRGVSLSALVSKRF